MSHVRNATLIVLVLLFLSAMLAGGARSQAHVKLLTVTESGNKTYGGSVADLYLDVQKGTGRVFIDTLPASKLDTQMSTRLAKNIACKYVNADCSTRDFFYTIRANSAIVGGPSASAAAAVVTIAVLENLELREDIAITGTIGSGNLIGPVGGLKDKIEAASGNGITTVLIPKGERTQKLEGNETLDLIAHGNMLNITVIEVGTLDEVMYQFTDKNFSKENKNVTVNGWYVETMNMLSTQLCNRSEALHAALNKEIIRNQAKLNESFLKEQESAENLTRFGEIAATEGKHYSSASYCYGANVVYGKLLLTVEHPSVRELVQKLNETKESVLRLNLGISKREIKTITDLEAYMVVKDRLIEANEHLAEAEESLKKRNNEELYGHLSYANERLHSAISWMEFLDKEGRKFKLEKDELSSSCTSKLSEVEEFYQYIELVFPKVLQDARQEIYKAEVDKERGNYELCLYKATIAKSQINMLSSLLGVSEDKVDELLERKLAAARQAIIEQQEKNIFPILGYSYYEYANTLREDNKYAALLYAEYALELSNLDIYFTSRKSFQLSIPKEWIVIFGSGIVIGFIINDIVRLLVQKDKADTKRKQPQKKKKKR